MLWQLGHHAFDLSTQARVMATVEVGPSAAAEASELIAAGAHFIRVQGHQVSSGDLALAIRHVSEVADVPVVAATENAAAAERSISAGALLVHDPAGFADPSMLLVVEASEASVVASCPRSQASTGALLERVRWARAAGIAADRVLVNSPLHLVSDVRTAMATRPIVADCSGEGEGVLGAVVHAAMSGARLIISNEVRAVRRAIDTVHELLQRRGFDNTDAGPAAVDLGSR